MSTRVAIYPGTFDPTTNGHIDIIHRGALVVDRLVVGVAVNAGKGPLFSLDERVSLMRGEAAAMADVAHKIEVRPFETLLMHFAQSVGAKIIVRGLRAVSDFEYEFQMAGMNKRLDPTVETLFLMASENQQFISSRFVKEVGRLGGDISHFVSPRIHAAMRAKFATGTAFAGGDPAPTLPPVTVPRAPL
jgi:pantetheine-phosphate adenylyltransferase